MSKLTDQEKLGYLHRGITSSLDEIALREICQELDLNYDELPGRGKQSKVWLLLENLKTGNKIPLLLSILRLKVPSVNWDEVLRGQSSFMPKNIGNTQTGHDGNLLKNPIIVGALITALVGCVATITVALVTGYFNLRVTDRPIEATQTAEAKLTKVAAMSQVPPKPGITGPEEYLIRTPSSSILVPNYPTATPQIRSTTSILLPAVTIIGITDTPTPTLVPAPASETKMVSKATTGVFFDNELIITVYQASWEEKKTTFGISSPGFTEDLYTDQVVSNRVLYIKNGTYEIAVTGFSDFYDVAEFTVTRLESPKFIIPTNETITVCKNDSETVFNKSLTISLIKSPWDENKVSFTVFAPGKVANQIENQPVGSKFRYEESGKYEIQIMKKSDFYECATFTIWRLP